MTVTDANIDETIKDGVVLLDFWAEWCGPCRMLAPIISEIETTNPNVKVGKIDVTTESRAAAKFGVRGIPKLVYLKDGEIVHEATGVQPKEVIQAKLNEIV